MSGRWNPVSDLNEGALARTVVPHQPKYLAPAQLEVDAAEGDHGAKGFSNAFGAQDRFAPSLVARRCNLTVAGGVDRGTVAHNLTLRPKRLMAARWSWTLAIMATRMASPSTSWKV